MWAYETEQCVDWIIEIYSSKCQNRCTEKFSTAIGEPLSGLFTKLKVLLCDW